jgi:peptidoglycan/LPS O-acetylase OafA/YrhL
MQRIADLRWKMLFATAVIFALMAPDGELPFPFEQFGREAFVWTTLLSILGFARALVVQQKRWLAYAQERAYPFYILHQTVIIVVGWKLLPLAPLAIGPWTRFLLVLTVSFVATCALCEIVGNVRVLRPLFGMPPPRAQRTRTTDCLPEAGSVAGG